MLVRKKYLDIKYLCFDQVLFRYAVAFFKYREAEILEQTDTMSIHRYLRELGDGTTDIERITQVLLGTVHFALHTSFPRFNRTCSRDFAMDNIDD